MSQALKLVAALVGLFAIVPLFTLAATGSMKRMTEAIKGYAIVLGLVIGLPMAIGFLIVLFASPFTD